MDDEDFRMVLLGLEDVRRFEAGEREGFVSHAALSASLAHSVKQPKLARKGSRTVRVVISEK